MDYYQTQEIALVWGPRIAAVIVILLVAHFLAKGAQWGLARLIDKAPALKRHNEGAAPGETPGHQLGQLAYWLVLLVGLIAALTVLGLTSVVTPLNALLFEVISYIPDVIGAVVIFIVGLVVATLARRVVEAALNAANVDRWLEEAGLTRVTGASGLAKTFGTLAFVLIIIPVTIAALQELGIAAISEPAVAVLATVLAALPRVLAAAIVLAIAFVIGRWVASLLEQILPSFGFDRSLQALGIGPQPATPDTLTGEAPPPAAGLTPSKVVAKLALVAIMLFSAVEAARLLAFAAIAVMLAEILDLAGHVLFGGVIITLGVLIANFLSGLINRSTGRADGFASTIVWWATVALATAMGLRFMGIADEIVILAFGLVLGSASVAAALAFGIGGRETAARLLEKWTRDADGKPPAPRPGPPEVPPAP